MPAPTNVTLEVYSVNRETEKARHFSLNLSLKGEVQFCKLWIPKSIHTYIEETKEVIVPVWFWAKQKKQDDDLRKTD